MAKGIKPKTLPDKIAYYSGVAVGYAIGLSLFVGVPVILWFLAYLFIKWWSTSFFNLGVWIYS